MLSRHYLRSKVLQAVYAAQADSVDITIAERNFAHNIDRLNDLGTLQVAALVHFAEVANQIMDEGQHKFLPTEEERNPNRRLANNLFVRRLADNYDLRRHMEESNVNWGGVEYDEAFRQAYTAIVKLDEYKNYLVTEQTFKNDQLFALKVFKFLMNHEALCELIQPQSLLWEDDYDQIAQYNFMMLKALNENMDEATLIPLMHDERIEKDVDAYEFARHLLLVTMRHRDEVEALIRKNLRGWEYDRIALMDVLLLNMAVAELTDFPSIPEGVTVDEYIELSKEFSTERSRLFINGIIDKFIIELRSAGRINKSGRGLIDPSLLEDLDMPQTPSE
jgi:N utilization substance protein B